MFAAPNQRMTDDSYSVACNRSERSFWPRVGIPDAMSLHLTEVVTDVSTRSGNPSSEHLHAMPREL